MYRNCDVSYNWNIPVSQWECNVDLMFMRYNVFFVFLFVKIKSFWLMGKIWGFVLQRIGYQRLFYWQPHLEILFCFHLMRAYTFFFEPNIDETTTNFTMYFSSNCHNLVKFWINKTIISFKPSVISKYRKPYNLSWALA